ncbi:MAG: IclR family transcriptional regulator [Deltaproteobacteria bacterium]|nr:IclR family transcriptional regulator [Deltaproteobacteria bacterium]
MKTVDSVFDILEIFLKDDERELSVSEIAKLSGQHPSTSNRIALALVRKGYLKQAGKRGKYSLGLKFYTYNNMSKRKIMLRDLARPYIEQLSKEVDESLALDILDGFIARHIIKISSKHILNIYFQDDINVDLYCTASGKAMLANFSAKQLEKYRKQVSLVPFTNKTITNFESLKKDLLLTKKRGYAFEEGERSEGVKSVAVPIMETEYHIVGSVSIIAPSTRLTTAKIKEVIPPLRRCAIEISNCLGYLGN